MKTATEQKVHIIPESVQPRVKELIESFAGLRAKKDWANLEKNRHEMWHLINVNVPGARGHLLTLNDAKTAVEIGEESDDTAEGKNDPGVVALARMDAEQDAMMPDMLQKLFASMDVDGPEDEDEED